MSLRCCSASSLVKRLALGAGFFTAGAVVAWAFTAHPATAPAAQSADTLSPFTGQVIATGYTQPEDPMDVDPMTDAFAQWGALAPEHEVLKSMVGTWDCTTKFWMGDPEPVVGKGTSTIELILGGRFVTEHFVMHEFMGGAYEGIGTFGYDKQKGKFVSTWLDTMSTGMNPRKGTWDEDTQTMTWTGTSISPMGESKVKYIAKVIDEDNSFMEFWEANDKTDGEFVKTGEITYTRQK